MATAQKVFQITKKVAWGILCGVFGIVFIITSWLFVDKFIMKSPVPSFLGYSTLTIETGSMSGTMEIGDLIVIKDTGDYKIGDIITFMPKGAVIPTTHRIINYTESGAFVTKGDANNIKDTDSATEDQILGEVVLHLPKLGQFASWVKQEGWVYILTTIAIVALGAFVLKTSQEEETASETANGEPIDTDTSASGENSEIDGQE
jgi:signal peptidase